MARRVRPTHGRRRRHDDPSHARAADRRGRGQRRRRRAARGRRGRAHPRPASGCTTTSSTTTAVRSPPSDRVLGVRHRAGDPHRQCAASAGVRHARRRRRRTSTRRDAHAQRGRARAPRGSDDRPGAAGARRHELGGLHAWPRAPGPVRCWAARARSANCWRPATNSGSSSCGRSAERLGLVAELVDDVFEIAGDPSDADPAIEADLTARRSSLAAAGGARGPTTRPRVSSPPRATRCAGPAHAATAGPRTNSTRWPRW